MKYTLRMKAEIEAGKSRCGKCWVGKEYPATGYCFAFKKYRHPETPYLRLPECLKKAEPVTGKGRKKGGKNGQR
jgi:hypothetical protein